MLDKLKLKSHDDCLVTLFILEHGLSTPLPIAHEDIETLVFNKIIECDYGTGEFKLCSRTNTEYKERIDEYRDMFSPKNINYPGKQCSKKNIIEKFNKFFKLHPEYTFDDVMKTTKTYIQDNLLKPIYIMKSSNFIYKREAGVWKSVLLDCLEAEKENVKSTKNLFL